MIHLAESRFPCLLTSVRCYGFTLLSVYTSVILKPGNRKLMKRLGSLRFERIKVSLRFLFLVLTRFRERFAGVVSYRIEAKVNSIAQKRITRPVRSSRRPPTFPFPLVAEFRDEIRDSTTPREESKDELCRSKVKLTSRAFSPLRILNV